MIIKSVYPVIITKDTQKSLDIFTEAGFTILHKNEGLFGSKNISYVLGNDLNQRVDIVYSENVDEKEIHSIRMNVDNLEGAIEHFAKFGYVPIQGPYDSDSMKSVLLGTPEHLTVMIFEHKRKDYYD